MIRKYLSISKDRIYTVGSKVRSNISTDYVKKKDSLSRIRISGTGYLFTQVIQPSQIMSFPGKLVKYIVINNSKLELMLTCGLNPIARALSSKVMGRVLKLCAGLSCESPCSPHLRKEIHGSN
jgi:hypothetical protein